MKDKILMVIFILVLGSILTTALLAVNSYTTPIIEKNNEIALKQSVLRALEINFLEENTEDVFSENIEVTTREQKDFYISREGNIAFAYTGSGLWGPIDGVIGIKPDFETIKAVTIIYQEETPGLGGRISEQQFLDRFKNKTLVPDLLITSPGKAAAKNEVDGISGATMSYKAFEAIINAQYQEYIPLIKAGN
ncbi:MAG TPA: FMN-binding protein [Spirochaetes bacterium]|nr:FMN-binding protein [Spirochaetota bacterium]